MAKEVEVMLDDDTIMDETPMQEVVEAPVKQPRRRQAKQPAAVDEPIVNCLRNERVIVKHVPKETGIVRDPPPYLHIGYA